GPKPRLTRWAARTFPLPAIRYDLSGEPGPSRFQSDPQAAPLRSDQEADVFRSFTPRSISILTTSLAVAAIQACDPAMTAVGASRHGAGAGDTVPPSVGSIVAASHTCALTTAGAAYCWGYSIEQPDGTDTPVVTPTLVQAPNGIRFQ